MKTVHNSRPMTRTAPRRDAESGFSLIELAVVVLIIGILLTMGLGAMNAVRENTALSATNSKQTAIKEALIGYLRRNSRLPCPDTEPLALTAPDGIENRATAGDPATACSSAFGILPYVTLGIPRDAAQDGWGNFFSYHVSNLTAVTNTNWTLSASFRTGNTGVITVNDRTSDLAAATPISTTVVAVIVSHGPNGFGAYTIGGTRNALAAVATYDERDNTNADTTYYRRSQTTDDASWTTRGAFDDIVMYLTADDLLNPLFKDGTLKPPAAKVSEDFLKFKYALVSYAMVNAPLTALGSPGLVMNRGGSGTGGCDNTSSTPKCKLLPYADLVAGNGWQNPPTISGELPHLDLSLTLADGTDPWGVRYRYNISAATFANNAAGSGISLTLPTGFATALTITSYGPDRAAGTDDITMTVSLVELRSLLSGLLP